MHVLFFTQKKVHSSSRYFFYFCVLYRAWFFSLSENFGKCNNNDTHYIPCSSCVHTSFYLLLAVQQQWEKKNRMEWKGMMMTPAIYFCRKRNSDEPDGITRWAWGLKTSGAYTLYFSVKDSGNQSTSNNVAVCITQTDNNSAATCHIRRCVEFCVVFCPLKSRGEFVFEGECEKKVCGRRSAACKKNGICVN